MLKSKEKFNFIINVIYVIKPFSNKWEKIRNNVQIGRVPPYKT